MDPAAQFICSDDELSAASLRLSQAYYAVRGASDRSFWQGYKAQAVDFMKVQLRSCAIPARGPVSSDRSAETKLCMLNDIRTQQRYWLAELQRLGKQGALEEATRDPSENMGLQALLKKEGFLSVDALIDGVFGEGTRQGVRDFQTMNGMPADGILSNVVAMHLSGQTVRPAPLQAAPTPLAPSAADSTLPFCPFDTSAFWTNCVGFFKANSGDTYQGQWFDNKPHGHGVWTFPNGDKYDGELRAGKRHGKGAYIYTDGSLYVGNYLEDHRSGDGIEFLPNGQVGRAGQWRAGQFVGPLASSQRPPALAAAPSTVKLTRSGGTFTVPALLNGIIPLEFTVDSGATDVAIPADVVMTLVRTGTISDSDFMEDQTYVLADGRKIKSKRFRLRSLRVGDNVVTNVTASIADVQGALLLGQSFLGRFARWSIDNREGVLILQ